MALEILDKAGYRKFGLTTGLVIIGLFGLLIPWLFSLNYPKWPWLFGGVLVIGALIAPAMLKHVYIGWMKFGQVMNWINTRLILGIVFYLVFLPTGLVMRLLGNDPMHRKLDRAVGTYRIKSCRDNRDNVERPY